MVLINPLLNASLEDVIRSTKGLRAPAKRQRMVQINPTDDFAPRKLLATQDGPRKNRVGLRMGWQVYVLVAKIKIL